MVKINTQISVERDYDLFKTVTGNRQVRPAHVKKLRVSLEQDPETIKYNPILINEHWQVIDGQHRLEAIKQLSLPVYYIQVPGLKLGDVQKLNSASKQWQPIDYANAFSKLGNNNYTLYIEVKEGAHKELSLNHDSLLRYLSLDNPITSQSFNEGKLKIDDFNKSLKLLKQLNAIGKYYDRYNIRSFALAFLRLATKPEYNHARMLDQMKKYSNDIEDYSREQDYYVSLIKVYNARKSGKNKEFFGSDPFMFK